MNILFLHPNFPGQFLHLARYFAHQPSNRVFFLAKETHGNKLVGVNVGVYKVAREATKGIHPYVKMMEEAVLEGQAVTKAMVELRSKMDFVPDVIVSHTGWGSSLYAKDIYPDVPVVGYFEWYYHSMGSDVYYWPSDVLSDDTRLRVRTMNAHHLLNLVDCDVLFTPTEWQRQQFPACFREGMKVIHEGVDTSYYVPDHGKKLVLPDKGLDLSGGEELVTYVSRGFEPYRGFPQFMEAVRILLKERPNCHVVLLGQDKTFYGPPPGKDRTWKQIEEEKGGYDKGRVHFLGLCDRETYRSVLQASDVHVYLTRPFVLSWSSLEAMASECCLVASKVPPVEEAMEDGRDALLVNFLSPEHIAFRIMEALDDPALRERLGKAARRKILERYDSRDCLRKQINMIYGAIK
ncbi:MAG: glycosyltransferase [Selenomonadaceae bacterium]|nr:glycosyltransferase [Selenomonadaceae bacterium]